VSSFTSRTRSPRAAASAALRAEASPALRSRWIRRIGTRESKARTASALPSFDPSTTTTISYRSGASVCFAKLCRHSSRIGLRS
jgi:hypothetical protein